MLWKSKPVHLLKESDEIYGASQRVAAEKNPKLRDGIYDGKNSRTNMQARYNKIFANVYWRCVCRPWLRVLKAATKR